MTGSGPVPIDYSQPSQARFHDALLGGADHYEADREMVRRVLKIAPEAPVVARELRQWMFRAVRFLAERCGVAQFADLGAGLPTEQTIHQVVQQFHPRARVVYVDNDPLVLAHGRARLADYDSTHFLGCDYTDPKNTLDDLAVHLDLDQPVGLVVCSMLHHLPDFNQARRVLGGYVSALAPGSFVLLTHIQETGDGSEANRVTHDLLRLYESTPLHAVARCPEQIEALLGGMEVLAPGLVHPHEWWPDGPRLLPLANMHRMLLCAVARKV